MAAHQGFAAKMAAKDGAKEKEKDKEKDEKKEKEKDGGVINAVYKVNLHCRQCGREIKKPLMATPGIQMFLLCSFRIMVSLHI